jgi:hypothetical protein
MQKKTRGVTSLSLIAFFYTAWFAATALSKGNYSAAGDIAVFTFIFFLIKPKGL